MKTLAVLLTLLLFSSFSAAQAPKNSSIPKKEECKISGRVIKLAGSEPLKNARIRLSSQDDRAENHSTTTDAGGRFDLKGIDPGRYRLVVHRDGFVTQEYGQKKPDDPGAILTLRAKQEMNDLLFRLIPSAVIGGRVINDDGDPLPWVQVSALREVYAGGKKTLSSETTVPTNDLGEYRLFDLHPGRYFIRAEYRPGERITGRGEWQSRDDDGAPRGYVPMYYPSGTEPARAATVAVKAGEEIPALEILLRRVEVFSVRGRVYNTTSRRSNSNYNVSLSPRDSDGWLSLPQREAIVDYKYGTFTIRDVLPGPYILSALWFDEGKRYQAYQSIDVGNADVEGVGLTLQSGMSLSGRVAWDGQPTSDTSRLTVYLGGAENMYGYGGQATVTPPWTFVLNDVHDSTYRVGVAGLCNDCYLKALRYGGAISPEDTFTPARGSNAPLELTISSKGARIRGSVVDADNLSAVGVWVVLVPDEAHRGSRRLYKSASTDQYGRFELRGIVPGDYKLFSWEEAESGAWEDPEFVREFEAKGEKISLQEGDQKTLDLTAIRTNTPESAKP
jgi:Carboxypeptidase regulatory-like domain